MLCCVLKEEKPEPEPMEEEEESAEESAESDLGMAALWAT